MPVVSILAGQADTGRFVGYLTQDKDCSRSILGQLGSRWRTAAAAAAAGKRSVLVGSGLVLGRQAEEMSRELWDRLDRWARNGHYC